MAILFGATVRRRTYTAPAYFEKTVVDPGNADVGERTRRHRSRDVGIVAIEVEAVAVPKVGAVISMYDPDFAMEMFGELG